MSDAEGDLIACLMREGLGHFSTTFVCPERDLSWFSIGRLHWRFPSGEYFLVHPAPGQSGDGVRVGRAVQGSSGWLDETSGEPLEFDHSRFHLPDARVVRVRLLSQPRSHDPEQWGKMGWLCDLADGGRVWLVSDYSVDGAHFRLRLPACPGTPGEPVHWLQASTIAVAADFKDSPLLGEGESR